MGKFWSIIYKLMIRPTSMTLIAMYSKFRQTIASQKFLPYFLAACVPHMHGRGIWLCLAIGIYTTLTLKIKGNHRCIYLIYPVFMATGVRYIPSSWQRYIFEIYPVVMATGVSYVLLLWQYAWVHFRNIPFLVNSMYDKFPILYTI